MINPYSAGQCLTCVYASQELCHAYIEPENLAYKPCANVKQCTRYVFDEIIITDGSVSDTLRDELARWKETCRSGDCENA